MLPPDGLGLLWGRVIQVDADAGLGVRLSNLLYIYDTRTPDISPVPWDQLVPDRWLIGPRLTNNTPWLRGVTQTVDFREIAKGEALDRHVFWNPSRKNCVDEWGEEVEGEEPMAFWGLGNYRTMDDAICKALDIELVD